MARTALPGAAAALLLGALAWWLGPWPLLGIDDADITLVYARHIAGGEGYVYVPGGERVEGSTSLLWTLAFSALQALLGEGAVRAGAFAASLGLCAVAVASALVLLRRAVPEGGGTLALLAWLAANPLFFLWNGATLMDLALFTAALHLGVLAATWRADPARLALATGAAATLLVLARPEGMLFGPLLCALAAAAHRARGGSGAESARVLARALALPLMAIACVTAWRLHYFGFPVPNTFYAKVSSHALDNLMGGLSYGWRFVQAQPWVVAVAGIAVVGTAARLLRWRALAAAPAAREALLAAAACAAIAGVLFGLPLLTGDDHFEGFRFFQPALPLVAVPFLAVALAPGAFATARRAALAVALLAAGAFNWNAYIHHNGLINDFRIAETMGHVGRELDARLGAGAAPPSAGILMAGGFALAYRGPLFDLLGLNDVGMAHATRRRTGHPGHSAFEAEVFWQRPPVLVGPQRFDSPPGSVCDAVFPLDHRALDALYLQPAFRERYVLGVLQTGIGFISAFYRRDWLDTHPVAGLRRVEYAGTETDPLTCHRLR